MSEIGLDIDHSDKKIVRETLLALMAKYDLEWLRLYISPTGRGFHIKFKTLKDYPVRKMLKIRKEFGDDPNRISMVDGVYRDVLFDMKMINGKKYRAKEIDVNAFVVFGKEVLV
jgi:hypothetical protein